MAKKAVKKVPAKKTAAPHKASTSKPPLPAAALPSAIAAVDGQPDVMNRLWTVVLDRRNASPTLSHSARLLSRGIAKVAQKFGEEAVECLIEAVAGNKEALVAESADVLYHLLVLWVSAGVHPSEVWAELERREGVSGIVEKAARKALHPGPATSKIP